VTYFSVNRKQLIYLRLSEWGKMSHPGMTQSEMWSAGLADILVIPRLLITALCNHLASDIGSMKLNI
jgi:hypothetical protein